jgi:hypothetical protein
MAGGEGSAPRVISAEMRNYSGYSAAKPRKIQLSALYFLKI